MNCLQCGAPLEEGSTSTLCAACEAQKQSVSQENPEPTAPLDPPVNETPGDQPAENLGGGNPPAEENQPEDSEDKTAGMV